MRRISLALAVAAAGVLSLEGAVSAQWPGARIAVVAYRDAGWLTVCPVMGRDVVYAPTWYAPSVAPVTVGYPNPGVQALGLHFERGAVGRAVLPRPSSQPAGAIVLNPDPQARGEIESALRRTTHHVVVPSPEAADYVLVVESSYVRLPPSTTTSEGVEWYIRADAAGTFRHVALAMLVPSIVYRAGPLNTPVLIEAAIWHGMAYSVFTRRDKIDQVREARMSMLVDQLYARAGQLPDYLPLCPASTPPPPR